MSKTCGIAEGRRLLSFVNRKQFYGYSIGSRIVCLLISEILRQQQGAEHFLSNESPTPIKNNHEFRETQYSLVLP